MKVYEPQWDNSSLFWLVSGDTAARPTPAALAWPLVLRSWIGLTGSILDPHDGRDEERAHPHILSFPARQNGLALEQSGGEIQQPAVYDDQGDGDPHDQRVTQRDEARGLGHEEHQ